MAIRATWALLQRALLAVGVLMLLGLALLPHLGLYRPMTVLSGSMRPTFSPGDMVLLAPEATSSVRVGQVISYRVPTGARQVETHRVVRIVSGAGSANPVIQTRGDANNHLDPWTARLQGPTAWRQVAAVPKLGYLIAALRAPAVRMSAVLIAPAALLLLVLFEIWGGKQPLAARGESASDRRRHERRGGERRVWVGPYGGRERRRGRDRRAPRTGNAPLPLPAPAGG